MRDNSNDKRIRLSKRKLRDSLLALMQTKKLEDITITELVAHAGLTRATFYKYYNSTDLLLREIEDDVVADLETSYLSYLEDPANQSQISASVIRLFEHVYRYTEFYKVIFNRDLPSAYLHRIVDVLKHLAYEELKHLPSSPAIDMELRANYKAFSWLGLVIAWVRGGFRFTPDYVADQFAEIKKHNQQLAAANGSQPT